MIIPHRGRLRGLLILLGALGLAAWGDPASAQFGGTATTESVCNFGMEKDEPGRSCEVPVPFECEVANFPGSEKPWANISKGGNTTCKFDEDNTDWKTRITGTCGTCKTRHCSARFSVMFVCGGDGGSSQFESQKPGR